MRIRNLGFVNVNKAPFVRSLWAKVNRKCNAIGYFVFQLIRVFPSTDPFPHCARACYGETTGKSKTRTLVNLRELLVNIHVVDNDESVTKPIQIDWRRFDLSSLYCRPIVHILINTINCVGRTEE